MDRSTVLVRYWMGRDSDNRDRELARLLGEGRLRLADAVTCRCTVLLAPPGAGKTTDLKGLVQSLSERARLISLGSHGDLAEKITHASTELGSGGADGLLALDSVDESTLPTSQLVSLIEEVAERLPDNVRLVLACRTAAWLPGLNYVLREAFGSDVTVLDLLPLTDDDVLAYAEAAGVDGQVFLEAARIAGATPLTRYPNELRFLLDLYQDQGGVALPHTQLDLYDRATIRLCSEPNFRRQPARDTGDERALRAGAGRLAVLSLFTTRNTFLLRGPGDGRSLGQEDYANILPETPAQAAYADVLGTALLEGAGDGKLRFLHQTVAEYLAARHLSDLDLTEAKLDALLRVPGGRLAPQVQAVASWLIALQPSRFANLLDDDPLAFVRSHVELIDPGFRQALLRRLLILADEYALYEPEHLELSGLAYEGIDELLRPYLTHRNHSIDARYLAVRIVSDNRLVGLNDILVDIAMSEDEPMVLRNAAGRRSLDLVPTTRNSRLLTLAERADGPPDEDDNLLGVGLRAQLRSGTSPSALLHRLKRPNNPDLFGSYLSFVAIELPEAFSAPSLTNDEVQQAVRWVAGLDPADRPAMPRVSGRPVCSDALQDAIVRAGLTRCDDPAVRGDVAHLVRLCLAEGDHQLFRQRNLSGKRKAPLPAVPEQVRRSLLLEVIGDDDDVVLAWAMARSGLLQADDLQWILDLMDSQFANRLQTMRAWLLACVDRDRADHQRIVESVAESSPAYRWLNPSPDPEALPELTEDSTEDAAPTDMEIRALLVEALRAEPADAFPRFCYLAHFEAGRPVMHPSLEVDVRELPGWSALNSAERRQAMQVADQYLRVGTDNGDALVGTDRFSNDALAGLRAVALIFAENGTIDLPNDRWAFWAPALIHTPVNSNDHLLAAPLRRAYERAGGTLLAAAEREMLAAPEFAQFLLQRLVPALEANAGQWLSDLADNPAYSDAAASVAYSRLLTLDPDDALRKVATRAEPTARSRHLAVTALQVTGSTAWQLLHDQLQQDTESAKSILGDLAAVHAIDPTLFAEPDLVAIWELMHGLFPPAEDPIVHGAHWIGPRETIGHERDRILPALADRGTNEAIRVLTDLAQRRPEMLHLRRLVARARAAKSRADWTQLTPNEVRLALSRTRRLLRNEAHLLEMIIEALRYTQDKVLQGMTPLATLLWDHHKCGQSTSDCRPKSEDEVSDLLDHQIRAYLPGVMVNREVQIRRLKPSGIGERSDLLVQVPATAAGERILRVVIEAKGCWNDEVSHALETQLAERYLEPMSDAAGLFLVAWFDPGHGARAGGWKNDAIRGDRQELLSNLSVRARAAEERTGRTIQAVVLDCSMPAKAQPATAAGQRS